MSYIIVIPARMHSSRLPEKVLADIGGRTMVEHVWHCARASRAAQVIIATDDERIRDVVAGFGAECVMTRADHASGSDRIAEVVSRRGFADDQVLVNLQGDEPQMPAACLDQVAGLLADGGDVATLYRGIVDEREVSDPNVVKVVASQAGEALYFSRAAIPHVRGSQGPTAAMASGVPFRRHVGLYAYRAGSLARFSAAAPSALERAEALEQLRFLELGMRIRIAEAAAPIPAGIDTAEDLERARSRIGDHPGPTARND